MSSLLTVIELFLLINQCTPEVHPRTMAAIIEAESSRNIYAINVNKNGFSQPKPETLEEAKLTFVALQEQGINFDVGLGQINSANFSAYGLTSENAFDPCTNLRAAGDILTQNFLSASKSFENEQESLYAAISAYNTGNYKHGLENGYVNMVTERASKFVVPDIEIKVSDINGDAVNQITDFKETWRVFDSGQSIPEKSVLVFK